MTHGALTMGSLSYVVVAAILVAIALLTLQSAPRRPQNQLFALFLALVAGNFFANFLEEYFTRVADRPIPMALVAHVFVVLDPAILLYFASVFPRRRAFARSGIAAAALLAIPAALLVAIPFVGPAAWAYQYHPYRVAFALYLAGSYLGALWLIVSGWAAETAPRRKQLLRLLVIAFGTAIIPRTGAFTIDAGVAFEPSALVIVAATFALVFGAAALRHRGRVDDLARVTAITGGLVLLVMAAWIPIFLDRSRGIVAEFTPVYTFRWFVFAGLVSYAILRYQVFDVDLKLARGATVGIVAGVALATFFAVASAVRLASPTFVQPLPEAVGALVAVGVAVPTARTARKRVRTWLAFASSDERLRQRRLEVYSATVVAALEDDRDPDVDAEVAALRGDLGLSEPDHRMIVSLARAERRIRGPDGSSVRPGTLVAGRYAVDRVLGHGRFGRTHLATDVENGARVVLKELRPEWRNDEATRARFEREREALQRIAHPNVVRLLATAESSGGRVLVLEHLAGGTLAERLRKSPVEPREAVRIAADLLRALSAIHREGIVHRDVKPENVLFDTDGVAKLVDLGIAHVDDHEGTLATSYGMQPGTPRYMSPEQARGGMVDERTDLYAVGVVLHEMLSGAMPAEGGVALAEVAPDLARAVERAIAQDPASRFRSAEEFLRALDRIVQPPPGG